MNYLQIIISSSPMFKIYKLKKIFLSVCFSLFINYPINAQVLLDLSKPDVQMQVKHYIGKEISIINNSSNQSSIKLDDVNFTGVRFDKSPNFKWIEFKNAIFFKDTFDGSNFSNTTFNGNTDFSSSNFKKTNFEDANFNNVSYRGVTVADTSSFDRTYFYGYVDFTFANIRRDVSFDKVHFDKFADFFNISLNDTATFSFAFAHLPDLIDFSGITKIKQDIDFTDADLDSSALYKLHRWHYINLYKTDIKSVLLDYSHFKLCFYNNNKTDNDLILSGVLKTKDFKYIYLDKRYTFNDTGVYHKLIENCVFKKYLKQIFPTADLNDEVIHVFINHWLSCSNFPARLDEDELKSVYEMVLKNFEAHGRKASYEDLDMQYQDFKNGWFIIPHYWYYYGYRKWMIFVWTFTFLFIFTIITFRFYAFLNNESSENDEYVYRISNIPKAVKQINGESKIYVNLKNLWHSFAYTSSVFFMLSLNLENLNFKKPLVVYIIIVYSIGILCLGYLANFILQK